MQNKMSVFQIVLIAVFGALAVAGVLIFAFAVGGNSDSSVGPVRVWGTLDETAVVAVIRQLAENEPGLSQVTYEQKDPARYEAELTEALAAGQGPDLYLLRSDRAYAEQSRLIVLPYTSLSETQFANTFADAAVPFLAEGGVLGIPVFIDPLVLYWNRDLMATAGYAKPPQFWDELFDIAKNVTKKTDAGTIEKSAIAFGEYANVPNAKDTLAMLIMQAGGRITAKDSSGKLVSSLTQRAGETAPATASALRFYTEFADPSKDDYTWNKSRPDARQAFASGDLALYIGFASEEPLIARMNPNLNFGVAQVPQVRSSDIALVTGRVYAFSVPKTSKNPQGAWTVAYMLAAAEPSIALSQALGIPGARRDVLSRKADGIDDLFNKMAIITRTWVDPDPARTDAVFRGMIENTTSGALLITEAVSRAEQEMSNILGL